MAARHYPVIIERGESADGCVTFGAFFPDLPGCIAGGDDINQAILGAEEALSGHVALMVRDGGSLPDPTPTDHMWLR
ncbi:MAG: type II toxin-antitoxin system HicB family antitoxin [Magnetococcales bacterium]|nr:type II toxin-antitoxin system HicB family antitoxin [Magnetococcales bacterium]